MRRTNLVAIGIQSNGSPTANPLAGQYFNRQFSTRLEFDDLWGGDGIRGRASYGTAWPSAGASQWTFKREGSAGHGWSSRSEQHGDHRRQG